MNWDELRGQCEVLAARHNLTSVRKIAVIDSGEFLWGRAIIYLCPKRGITTKERRKAVKNFYDELRALEVSPPLEATDEKILRQLGYDPSVHVLGYSQTLGMSEWEYEVVVATNYSLARGSYHKWRAAADEWKAAEHTRRAA